MTIEIATEAAISWRCAIGALAAVQCGRHDDAVLDAAMDRARAVAEKVWATPARSLEDVMLRAKLAEFYSDGLSMVVDVDPHTDVELKAAQQLVRACLDVLGSELRGREATRLKAAQMGDAP